MTKSDYLAMDESAIRALAGWELDAACNEIVMPFDCWPTEFCPSANLLDAARATAAMIDRGWVFDVELSRRGCEVTAYQGDEEWSMVAVHEIEAHARTLAAVLAAWREEGNAI